MPPEDGPTGPTPAAVAAAEHARRLRERLALLSIELHEDDQVQSELDEALDD